MYYILVNNRLCDEKENCRRVHPHVSSGNFGRHKVTRYYGFGREYVRESCSGEWKEERPFEEILVLKFGSDSRGVETVGNERRDGVQTLW